MGTPNFQAKTLGYSIAVGYLPHNHVTDDYLGEGELLDVAVDFLTAINPFLWENFFADKVHTQPLLVAFENGRLDDWRLDGWRLKIADSASDETNYIAFRNYWEKEFLEFAQKVDCTLDQFLQTLHKATGFAEYALMRLAYHTGLEYVTSDEQAKIGAVDVLAFAKRHRFGGEFEGLWADFVKYFCPKLAWTLKVGVKK